MPVLNTANNVFLGSTQADAVYAGDVRVWPSAVSALTDYGQVGGDWVSQGWGTSGWIICDVSTIASLPPGVTLWHNGAQYTWPGNESASAACAYPPGHPNFGSGIFACWYGQGVDVTLTFAQPWTGTIRAYFVSHDPENRSERATLLYNGVAQSSFDMIATDPATWIGAGISTPSMLPGGRWLGWDVNLAAGDVIGIHVDLLGGVNAVFHGVVFDEGGPEAPWTPAAIPGLAGWWDASTLDLLDGEAVNLLPDLSEQGNNLVLNTWDGQTGGAAPRFASSALNGHGVLRYDGTNVLLATQGEVDYRHFLVVAKYDASAFPNYNGLLSGYNTHLLIGDWGLTTWYSVPGVYHKDGILSSDFSGPMAQWAIMSLSNVNGWPGMSSFRLGVDRFYGVGYNRYWSGDIAEVIAYNRELGPSARAKVEGYLRNKYNLP